MFLIQIIYHISECKIIMFFFNAYTCMVWFGLWCFNATFNNISVIFIIVVVSFIGGVNRSTRRKPAASH